MKKILILVSVLALATAGFAAEPTSNSKENIRARVPQFVAYSSATNILGPVLQLRPNSPISVQMTFVGTNTAALSNLTAVFRYSNDGRNWTTTGNQSLAVAANGTNVVTAVGSVTNTSNPRFGQLYYLTNAGSGATFSVNVSNVITTVWDP